MEWRQLTIDVYGRISQVLDTALAGLSQDDLNRQPNPDSNSMGWLAWHLTRVQDRAIADLMGQEQLWVKDKWYSRFDRPSDPQDFGLGHSSEDVAAFKSPDAEIVLAYHRAVAERTKSYIGKLSETDLDRKMAHPRYPTLGARLMGVISDNLQHAGQVAYVRGLLKGKGWLDT